MKKINYILFLLLTGLCFNACVSEEEDLFEKSAAERMNEALAKYKAILQDNPEGWLMEFYPSDRSMGGYTYTAKFNNGKVDMTGEISLSNSSTGEKWPAGTVVSSNYQVISEQSAVLTFDTYNPIFHFFSEPKGSNDVDGYASDYEFVFMKVSEDSIILKGKKYENKMVMTKLTESAGSYMQKVLAMQSKLAAIPRMKMIVGGKAYTINMVGKVLSYTEQNEDSSLENIDMAYIYTPEGIRLYEPLTVNGVTFQELVYDEASGVIKGKNADVSFPYPTALEQFCGTTSQWGFTFDLEAGTGEMNDELLAVLIEANEQNFASQYETITNWFIGANPTYPGNDSNPFCMGWISYGFMGGWNVAYGYNMSIVDEASNKLSLRSTAPGINYTFYPYFDPIIEYVDMYSPYIVEFDDDDAPTIAKFVSSVDSGVWFGLTKQQM